MLQTCSERAETAIRCITRCLRLDFESSVFGAVSYTVLSGDFLGGCLVTFASLFVVFKISLEIAIQKKGKNET